MLNSGESGASFIGIGGDGRNLRISIHTMKKGRNMREGEKSTGMDSRIYLCAPVNALVEGIYEENIPLSQVTEHGDFGLGTFHELDGEMVILDGRIYRIASDGSVTTMDEKSLTPFACVTFFQPECSDRLEREVPYREFKQWLSGLMPSPNIFYAFRIEGVFSHVRTRSVPRQENYRPLVEVAREQPIFDFHEVEGTLAGFYTPPFMASLSVPGIHLHFLSDDLRQGGHLLECRPRSVVAGVQLIYTLELSLPRTLDYLTWDFQRDTQGDLEKAEK
jgi:acetolactate decarboxylase